MQDRNLLVHAMEKLLATPSYQLLLQKDPTLLVGSDGGAINDYGSFGWVPRTDQEVLSECKGIARDYTMHSRLTEGYGRISLLLLWTQYLRYLNIHPPGDRCITSYCDCHSLLNL
jgi:hypothetical protein